MPIFHYQAVDSEGKTVKKTIEADSQLQAKQRLSEQSLVVFELAEAHPKSQRYQTRLSQTQRNLLINQLATLLGAGYTLENALRSCGRQSQDARLKQLVEAIHQRVVEGVAFHQALAAYPKIFDETFCATVKAGESSGYLATVLAQLAEHAETATLMRDNVRQALVYPMILAVVAGLMIAYLMTAVVPDVVKVFIRSGQELPAITQVLLTVSHIIADYGIYLLVGFVVLIFGLRRCFSQPKWRAYLHRWALRLPILSPLTKAYHTATYSATLSILLNAGVKLVDALNISSKTLKNQLIRSVAENACDEVQQGKSLAQSLMTEKHVFPGMLIELIDSGERTGQLAPMLAKAGEIYRHQSESRLKTLTALLGPLMILVMGGIIFVIVLAILLPIFDLNQAIR